MSFSTCGSRRLAWTSHVGVRPNALSCVEAYLLLPIKYARF